MVRLLIIILFSFTAGAADYWPRFNVDGQDHVGDPTYSLELDCQDHYEGMQGYDGCIKLPPGYNYRFYVLAGNTVVIDPAKKSADDLTVAAGALSEAAIRAALKAQRCGRRVKALLLVRNAPKGLTNGQKKQLVSDHGTTIRLLDAGSLDTARAEILATPADGTIITEGDKTALVAELDNCK